MSEDKAVKVYTKANVPIVGTYKQYAAKNTNAGLDWAYIELSPQYTLYYAKGEFCGMVINDKAFIANFGYEIRGAWTLSRTITTHMMKVIASGHGLTLDDHIEITLAKKYWLANAKYHFQMSKMPYLLKEVLGGTGEITQEVLDELSLARDKQFA